jgi:hypothetical protein
LVEGLLGSLLLDTQLDVVVQVEVSVFLFFPHDLEGFNERLEH